MDLTLEHLHNLMPRLRRSDVSEILDASRYDSIEQWARSRVTLPGIAWALEERGVVQACGGVLDGAVAGIGEVWLVGSEHMGHLVKHVLRAWRVVVVHGGYRRLGAKCFTTNEVANRFAVKVGFNFEGTLRAFTQRGEDLNQYGMVPNGR